MAGNLDGSRGQQTEMHQQVNLIQESMTDRLCDLSESYKRWLLVGIGLHTVLSPALRKFVKPKLDKLWQKLNSSHGLATQLHPNQMKCYLNTYFNYEAINGNRVHGLRQQEKFDYKVKNSVDLSKLFLHTNMAQFTDFESCDLYALLGIIMKTGICSISAMQYAEQFRGNVFKPWAHCNHTQWNHTKYTESLELMEKLALSLGLSVVEEQQLMSDLTKWRQIGTEFIEGKANVFAEVTKQVQRYAESIVFDTTERIQTLVKAENIQSNHELEKTVLKYKEEHETFVKRKPVKYPSAIYKMDDESRKLYAKALKEGLEVKREIRVIVVGKKAAGKTSLIKRLLSKSISDVTSTNGVDIYSVACEDETQFGDSWNEKLPTAADETDEEVVYQCIENDESPGSSMTSSQEGKEIPTSDEDIEVMETNYKKENIQSVEMLPDRNSAEDLKVSTTNRKDGIDTHLAEMTNAEMINENEVRIAIWDFGGDEEFYYTHPVFLAHDVVFLIVTSLADTEDKSHGELKFWFDTIHCLCNDREDSKELNPPCIVVGTHMDKCEPEDTADKLLFNKLKAVGDLSGHVFGEPFLISNTDYSEENNQTLKEIQKAIAEAAKKSKDWKAIHPLKFILLDKALEKEKTVNENKPTVAFDDIKHINTSLTNPLTDKELELYLQYNHATGHLIYYEDIPNYIVIKPQWLSDVFRCIVTADKFWKKVPLKYMSDWTQLRYRKSFT